MEHLLKATIANQQAQLTKKDELIEQQATVIKNLTKRIAELKAKPIKRRRKNDN